jgi:hypothetical protein
MVGFVISGAGTSASITIKNEEKKKAFGRENTAVTTLNPTQGRMSIPPIIIPSP